MTEKEKKDLEHAMAWAEHLEEDLVSFAKKEFEDCGIEWKKEFEDYIDGYSKRPTLDLNGF